MVAGFSASQLPSFLAFGSTLIVIKQSELDLSFSTYQGKMIYVTDSICLHENEIQLEFIRASGPGGQNVNKVSSAVQLRFDAANSPALSGEIRNRLKQIAGRRMTTEGVLIIEARRFRTQDRNRQDAIDRLIDLIRKAADKPKQRRRTQPSPDAKQKRLTTKRHRGEIKRQRRSVRIAKEDA